MNNRVTRVLLLVLFLPLAACMQPAFEVRVDAFADVLAPRTEHYVLLPANPNTPASDLQFREFAGYVARALAIRGYRRVADPDHADILVYLDYGISGPDYHEELTSFPVWGQTGMTVYTDPETGSTSHFATIGVIGYDVSSFTTTTYDSFLSLEAYDQRHYRATGEKKQLWKVVARSSGSSGDLRRVFPVMMAVAQDYLAKDIGRQVSIDIREDDPRVLTIKGLPLGPASERRN